MARIITLALSIAVLLLGSCGNGNDNGGDPVTLGDFVMNFSDFGPHLNQDLRVKVAQASSGNTIADAPVHFVDTETFTITIDDILESGETYNIDVWADVDDDGILDGTPLTGGVDHAWRFVRTADAAGINFTYVHDTNFTDIRPF